MYSTGRMPCNLVNEIWQKGPMELFTFAGRPAHGCTLWYSSLPRQLPLAELLLLPLGHSCRAASGIWSSFRLELTTMSNLAGALSKARHEPMSTKDTARVEQRTVASSLL